jgi:hypothetical protein
LGNCSNHLKVDILNERFKKPTKLLSIASGFVLLLGVATRESSHPVGSNPLSCCVFVLELSTPVNVCRV